MVRAVSSLCFQRLCLKCLTAPFSQHRRCACRYQPFAVRLFCNTSQVSDCSTYLFTHISVPHKLAQTTRSFAQGDASLDGYIRFGFTCMSLQKGDFKKSAFSIRLANWTTVGCGTESVCANV